MFTLLAILGGMVGLFFIGLSVMTIRQFVVRSPEGNGNHRLRLRNGEETRKVLLRWNMADYLLLFPAAFAFLFLLVDVIAVLRDQSLFPDYHIGYLLCGFVLFLLSFGFLYARLLLAMTLSHKPSPSHQEPNPTEGERTK
ncbi:hypothetical protein [Gorillibacterium timonense]|uniref:hypothetical protein n=1 Tax=Gorillibacterium timonense TaxID=1689269 RepID=UPI00071D52F9|nr:hypothetical protein [Gorillibacterium timonense]